MLRGGISGQSCLHGEMGKSPLRAQGCCVALEVLGRRDLPLWGHIGRQEKPLWGAERQCQLHVRGLPGLLVSWPHLSSWPCVVVACHGWAPEELPLLPSLGSA